MTQRLDGARLKIVRAQEHLDSLRAEIRMFLDKHPTDIIRSTPDCDHDLQRLDISLVQLSPPVRLSTIIGDCVTNARASLDYITWELVDKFFVQPFDETKYDDRILTSFPIRGTFKGTGFRDRLDRLADRGVPTAPISEIEAAQADPERNDALLWLHKLVNRDKHRTLLLTMGTVNEVQITLATPPIYADLIKTPAVIKLPGDRLPKGIPFRSDVQMKADTTIGVTWPDASVPRLSVDTMLEQIIDTAAHVVTRFDGLF